MPQPHRLALSLLLLAGALSADCLPTRLHVVDAEFVLRHPNFDGTESLYFRADLQSDLDADLPGAWAYVVNAPPAGRSLLDDILQFGPTPAHGRSTTLDGFWVRVPTGTSFDPDVLRWAVIGGIQDADADGLSEGEERDSALRTDPRDSDSDGDGVGDGIEARFGTAPLDARVKPTSFSPDLFYSLAPRPSGEPALAVGWSFLPPLVIGEPHSWQVGLAFDRHGFLYAARGAEIAHLDALRGAILHAVPLHEADGDSVSASLLAYDPTRDVFVAVEDDPSSGGPTRQLLEVDVHSGLATRFGAPLAGAPRAIAILPEIQPEHGWRWLYAALEEDDGTQRIHVVELGGAFAYPSTGPLPAPITGLAFDHGSYLVQVTPWGDGGSEVSGGEFLYSSLFDVPLGPLAIPRTCPAPCFGEPVMVGDAVSIAPGDIDADGDVDVVAAQGWNGGWWYENDGTGQLAAQPLPWISGEALRARSADVDGDGSLDVAIVTYEGELWLLRGHGDGSFESPVIANWGVYSDSLAIGDVTGDARADLVTSGGVAVNDGSGGFAQGVAEPFGSATRVALADLDADAGLEIVALYGNAGLADQSVAAFAPDGAGGLVETQRQPLGFYAFGITAADLDGDERDDVIVTGVDPATGDGVAATLRSDGGTLQPPVSLASVPQNLGSADPVAAEWTGDGHVDLMLPSCAAPWEGGFFVGDGAGGFRAALFPPANWADCSGETAAADLDGDGLGDLLSAGYSLTVQRNIPPYPVLQ